MDMGPQRLASWSKAERLRVSGCSWIKGFWALSPCLWLFVVCVALCWLSRCFAGFLKGVRRVVGLEVDLIH